MKKLSRGMWQRQAPSRHAVQDPEEVTIKNSNLLPAFCPQASIPIGIKAELHNRDVAPTDLPARVGIYPLIYQGLRATHLPPQC